MKTNCDNVARLESLFIDEFDRQVREVALNELAPQKGERVLVIGFGTRHSQAAIARAVGRRGKALGFDLSKRTDRSGGQVILLPHEPNSLDGIFTSFTLERFPSPPLPAVLAECNRVLRPGGRIVVIGLASACQQGSDSDSRDLRRLLSAAGFVIKDAHVRRMWVPVEIVLAVKGSGPGTGDRH